MVIFFLLQTACIIISGYEMWGNCQKCVKVCYLGGSGVQIDAKLG